MDFWWVCLGAAVGAPARYLIDLAVRRRVGSALPWGTITVNVVGSLVLGLLVGAEVGARTLLLLGTGFCGALTTYSAFAYETVSLAEGGRPRAAALNVVVSLAAGLLAALVGLLLGRLTA